MNINNVLQEYDALFAHTSVNDIQEYLLKKILEAENEGDISSVITLENELIGLCRSTMDQVTARNSADRVLKLLGDFRMDNTEQYAVTLINIATTFKFPLKLRKWQTADVFYPFD